MQMQGQVDSTNQNFVGVGLRAPHFEDFASGTVPVDWVEVHSETFFCQGGPRMRILERVCEHYPVSLHGVGLSLGSAERPDNGHLEQLKKLIERVQPILVSEHVAWARVGATYMNDLLPMPLTQTALDHITTNIDIVQQVIGRQILMENPSTYLAFEEDEMPEYAFLASIVEKTSCKLLLDVNNIYVSALNHQCKAIDWLDNIDGAWIGEYHLAGHRLESNGDIEVRIDDHASPVSSAVWSLFDAALEKFGARYMMIEWDSNIPALSVLMDEVEKLRIRCANSLIKAS